MPSVDIRLCPLLALTDVDPKFLNVRIWARHRTSSLLRGSFDLA